MRRHGCFWSSIVSLLYPVIGLGQVAAQGHFYYYKGNKIPLDLSEEKIIVEFSDGLTDAQKSLVLASDYSLSLSDGNSRTAFPDIVIVDINKTAGATHDQVMARLNKSDGVISAWPVFVHDKTQLQGIFGEFLVKLKSPSDYLALQRLTQDTRTEIKRQNRFDPSLYVVEADKYSMGNALDLANYFHETGLFEFVEPNFLRLGILDSNDPHFAEQWSIQNTGQWQYGGVVGADMNVLNAWSISTGSDEIKVAIIDTGVDLDHPDLIDNMLPGYDVTGQGSGGAPIVEDEGKDPHGTACAGIIAAKADNGIGVAGVCPNCRIVPVRALPGGSSTDEMLSDGINWAWQNGADVLSNSWGTSPSMSVENAISNALTNGRGGLGCVVLFAAGNFNSSVSFPATLPGVIAVGAMSMCNERKRSSSHGGDVGQGVVPDAIGVSCDGEVRWGSNYGSGLDLVAPGVRIATTDISGTVGYNNVVGMEPYDNDYVADFFGTSSAAPNAAGVCALVLSVNPCLTSSEVNRIIELSCDKVGLYCYAATSGHPNGTWNEEMGHGRVNAYNAVRLAFSEEISTYANIAGSDQGIVDCNGDACPMVVVAGGCSGLLGGVYYVYPHLIEANVTYPYTPGTEIFASSNGIAMNSPNSGNYFTGVSNVSATSATLFTYVFDVYSISWSHIGWRPTHPANIKFNYSVLSILDRDLFFQNQLVTGGELHNAMHSIWAGRYVSDAIPVGDYVIDNGAEVVFHAGTEIVLSDGFETIPGGLLAAHVDPFFTCDQYPGIVLQGETADYPAVIKDHKGSLVMDTATASEIGIIRIFPNPLNTSATVEYRIRESEHVRIVIRDRYGRDMVVLRNSEIHQGGVYRIRFDAAGLAAGVYSCTLEVDGYRETRQIVKIE